MSNKLNKNTFKNRSYDRVPPKTYLRCESSHETPHEIRIKILDNQWKFKNSIAGDLHQFLDQRDFFSLEVLLKGNIKIRCFPIQLFTCNLTISKEIESNGFLDLSTYSKETFDLFLGYFESSNKKSDRYTHSLELIKLICYVGINKVCDPLINSFLMHNFISKTYLKLSIHIHSLNLSSFHEILSSRHFHYLQKHIHLVELRNLDLSYCTLEYGLEDFISKIPCLNILNLSHCRKIKSSTLRVLVDHCKYLRILRLSALSEIKDADIAIVIKNSPDLRVLDISSCSKVTGSCLFELKAFSYAIRELYVSNLSMLSHTILLKSIVNFSVLEVLEASNLKSISKHFLSHLQQKSPALRKLILSTNATSPSFPNDFFNAFHLIETLHLPGMKSIRDHDIKQLLLHSKYLSSLDISGCTKISDQSLETAPKSKGIKHLNLSGLKKLLGHGLAVLTKSLSLETLILQHCKYLKKEHLIEVIKNSPNLLSLDLSYLPSVDDELIQEIASHCKKLKEIRLSSCKYLKGHSLKELLISCTSLEVLEMGGCKNLRKDILTSLNGHTNNLKGLGIAFQNKIPVSDLIKLLKNMPELEKLSLNRCHNVNDAVLEVLALHCKKIKTLHFYYCKKISILGMSKLLPASPYLENLEIRGTGISEYDIIALLSKKTFLQNLYMTSCAVMNRNILTANNPDLKIHAHTY